jgi:nicotinamidase-related amidase
MFKAEGKAGFDAGFASMTTALLLIDLQIDFLSDKGRMPVGTANADRVIMTANRMIKIFEERRWPVIVVFNQFKKTSFIMNYFRNHAAIEGSEGCRMAPGIVIHDGRFRICEKKGFGSCQSKIFWIRIPSWHLSRLADVSGSSSDRP